MATEMFCMKWRSSDSTEREDYSLNSASCVLSLEYMLTHGLQGEIYLLSILGVAISVNAASNDLGICYVSSEQRGNLEFCVLC